MRIGITIGLHHEGESLWNNGIKQNALFLAQTLMGSHCVERVLLVNTTNVSPVSLPWDRNRWPVVSFEEAKDQLDVVIELGGQIDAAQTAYLKSQGTRLISYCCGSEYVHAAQSILFGRPLWNGQLFVNSRYDDVWMVPQVAAISGHFFQTLRRCPARIVPFVWDPVFLRERSAMQPENGEYRPRSGPRRLSVMEGNMDVVKFCLYPILIAELAWRAKPKSIKGLHVTNSAHLAEKSPDFIAMMSQLDIVRHHRAVFMDYRDTPTFLAELTDVVISHQWENPLNYFYLEVCWQGYPLVHNAHMCKDLGYYYCDHDVDAGAQQLLYAVENHDSHWRDYRDKQRSAIERYLPRNPDVVARYEELLLRVMRMSVV